jgi:hypothetical protein
VANQGRLERQLVIGKQYSYLSASIVWTTVGFMLTGTIGQILCQEFAFPYPLLYVSAFHTCILCSFFLKYRFLIKLVISCKTLWDDECSHLIKTS